MIGASLLAWKTAISEASSPASQILGAVGLDVGRLPDTNSGRVMVFSPAPRGRHPALMGVAVGLLLLGNGAVVIWVGNRLRSNT